MRGSILLESLIAITVVTVALLGIFSLLSRSLGLTRVIADRYVAANLAAEGIELIKNIIDTNSIAGLQWNRGLSNGNYEMTYRSDLEPAVGRRLFFNAGAGVYDYSPDGVPTTFERKIKLQSISSDEIRVNSIVNWVTRGGGTFDINLEDHFFNWRKSSTP